MTDYLEMFPSKYIRAADIPEDVNTVVKSVMVELLENKKKLVVNFVDFEKGLILNKTNAEVLADIARTGMIEKWAGVPVALTVQYITYQGKTTPAIRIQPVRQIRQAPAVQQTAQPEQVQGGNAPEPA